MPGGTRGGLQNLGLGAMCAAAVTLSPLVAQAQQAIRLSPGQSGSLTFAENRSTGFSWAIDPVASKGLDTVAVTDGGYVRGGTMPGAPGKRLWILRALTSGHAEIAFVYRRPGAPAPVDARRVVVDVAQ